MKTKKQFYLLAMVVLFASIFFSGKANAITWDECINDYNGTPEDCAGYPEFEDEPSTPDYPQLPPSDDPYAGSDVDALDPDDPYAGSDDGSEGFTPSFFAGVASAGSYSACVSYCDSIGDSGDCFMACGEEYDPSGGGNGSGNGYECTEPTPIPDPKDSSNCLPDCSSMGTGMMYSYKYDDCRGSIGSSCINSDECGSGYSCNSSNTCEKSVWGSIAGGEFDTPTNNQTQTQEAIAAAKAAAAASKASSVTAMHTLNNALKNKSAADAAVSNCGTDAAACQRAQAAAAAANAAMLQAQAEFDTKIAQANADAVSAGANTNTGAGFTLCGNGILGSVCTGGPGTPIVLGASNGIIPGGGLNYNPGGFSGVSTPKCGLNFSEIGGVCFPTNTGLSNAPISTILMNLFSWLMGLFTTLAIVAFVISGLQYFMASGDESLAKSAKTNATNAVLGIIVGLSGFIIIKAIAAALSGQGYFF